MRFPFMPYQHVLLALAGKEDEESVIREAVRLTAQLGARLTVLHVNAPTAGKTTMMMNAEPLLGEEDLRAQFRTLGYEHVADEAAVRIVAGASYPKEIAAASRDADLLVIGHRQRHGFLHAFIDTVDKHVTDLVSCPILVVPRWQEA